MYCRCLRPHSRRVSTIPSFQAGLLRGASCRGYQKSSTQSQSAVAPSHIAGPLESTFKSRPFAIERVGGRECHVSLSEENGLLKEWRDLPSASQRHDVGPTSSFGGRLSSWFRQMFLPTNYPQSVHRSYLPFHALQFFETTFGTVVTVLCNQALLTSVGVSAEASIFGAVAVQWIIKDGAGEVAKLFFIRHFSPYFDSHPKTFTLFGEGIVALGSGLQLATLLVAPTPGNFMLCAAGGNIFKLVGYAIWFTTHIKFMRYFSTQGNTGDVAAKDESQTSIAQLTGYAAGIGLLTVAQNPAYLFSLFAVMVPAHMTMTTYMMRVATFELLTLPRLSILGQEFDEGQRVPSLKEMDAMDAAGVFGEFYKRKEDKYLTIAPRVSSVVTNEQDASRWDACANASQGEKYLLYPSSALPGSSISVFYHPDATSDDMLRSVLHAARLRRMITDTVTGSPDIDDPRTLRATLLESRSWISQQFDPFKQALEEKGWRTDEICFADHGHRVLWGREADRDV